MEEEPRQADVIVFGMGRYGTRLATRLNEEGLRVFGVDFDPEVLSKRRSEEVPVTFGDVEDEEFVAHLPLNAARCVISTLRDAEQDRGLILALRRLGYRGWIAVTAHGEISGSFIDVSTHH